MWYIYTMEYYSSIKNNADACYNIDDSTEWKDPVKKKTMYYDFKQS